MLFHSSLVDTNLLTYAMSQDFQNHSEEDDPAFPDIPEAHVPPWRVERIRKMTEGGEFERNIFELWWADHYHILLSHGYRLRRRYRPDWTPSWLGTDVYPYYCDDCLESIASLFLAHQ